MFGTVAKTSHLAEVALPVGATRLIDADTAIQALHLNPLVGYVNLVYSFVGDKSDILVSAGSVDGAGTYVFETPASPTIHSMSRTICHWQLGDGVDTMFTIWNHGAAPEDLLLTFNYEGGEYSKAVHLEAKASVMLSIEDLVARSEPDVKGRFLPINLAEGSAKVSGTRGELEHIDASIAVASYNVNKATCNVRCVNCSQTAYTTFYNAPGSFQLPEGTAVQSTAIGKTRSGGTYDVTKAVTWSSSDNTVFTVATGASGPGYIAAVAPGKAMLSFESLPVQNIKIACGDPPVCDAAEPITVDTVTEVVPTVTISGSGSVVAGGGIQLTATGKPSGGTYSWSSSTSSITLLNGSTAIVTAIGISGGHLSSRSLTR